MENKQQETAPLVSFIIACYNLPVKLLSECIDSILALSLSPNEREIIVVDDGSDVSLMDDLMTYGDNIIYVRQKHAGLSSARNTGIQMAKGKYLQFIDGDDELMTSNYNACIDIIRQHHDADMVLFGFDDEPPTSGTSFMRHHNIHGAAWGYLFSRTTLSDLRFTPGIFHEDELFTPQLLIRAEVVYPTKAKAYCYKQRPDSITTTRDTAHVEKRQTDALQVILELNKMVDRLPTNDQLAMDRRVAQLTMDYLYNTIIQTRSLAITQQRIQMLRAEGLFPLPNRNYTTKYQWFRRLSNTKLGLAVLVKVLPMMKRER